MSDSNKKNSSTILKLIFLFLLLGAPVLWIMFLKKGEHYASKLPIYFEKLLDEKGDTLYHTIDDFSFVNQVGQQISLDDLQNKILLVNFFFATCPDVCPKMNKNMQYIYREFLKDDDVVFLSHTVDPEHDNPDVLLEYSKRFGAEAPKWNFLTGSKALLYDMAENSYKIPGAEDAEHAGFFHSQNIVVVDKEGRVRGIFDGMKGMHKEGNPKIIDAVRALKFEYSQEEKK
jgi:protein SCO1/2